MVGTLTDASGAVSLVRGAGTLTFGLPVGERVPIALTGPTPLEPASGSGRFNPGRFNLRLPDDTPATIILATYDASSAEGTIEQTGGGETLELAFNAAPPGQPPPAYPPDPDLPEPAPSTVESVGGFAANLPGPPPDPIGDCREFDRHRLRVLPKRDSSEPGWFTHGLYEAGSEEPVRYFNSQADAVRTLGFVHHYGLNQVCRIQGRYGPGDRTDMQLDFWYFLVDGRLPEGPAPGEADARIARTDVSGGAGSGERVYTELELDIVGGYDVAWVGLDDPLVVPREGAPVAGPVRLPFAPPAMGRRVQQVIEQFRALHVGFVGLPVETDELLSLSSQALLQLIDNVAYLRR